MENFNNAWFLTKVKESFSSYLSAGSSRKNDKLKPLHRSFADAILNQFKDEPEITVKSLGYGEDEEGTIEGKYASKKVDITVYKNDVPIAGYAVKFVMRNFSQNVVNYFDNMLGETVNIRSKNIPYFQILILFDKIPYFKSGGVIDHWEDYTNIKKDKFNKYEILSKDDPSLLNHVPNRMLLVLLKLKDIDNTNSTIDNFKKYKSFYLENIGKKDLIKYSRKINKKNFENSVIVNNFSDFIKKSCCIIKGRAK